MESAKRTIKQEGKKKNIFFSSLYVNSHILRGERMEKNNNG